MAPYIDYSKLISEAAAYLLLHAQPGKHDGVIIPPVGICYNIERVLEDQVDQLDYEDLMSILKMCFISWDKFSGDLDYPVGGRSEYAGFNLWIGESGVLRRDLLAHIIKELSDDA